MTPPTTVDPNFAIVGVITMTAIICMTIQPIVAFGLIPLLSMLWLVWATNMETMAEYQCTRIKAIFACAMAMNETTPNNLALTENSIAAVENNLALTANNIATAVENTIALTENTITLTENNIALTENNTEPSNENNNTKEPKDDDDRSAATTPHCV